jgi:hypothetical protein
VFLWEVKLALLLEARVGVMDWLMISGFYLKYG